jgi:hypothetical protein
MYAHGDGLHIDLLVECSEGVHQGDGAGMVYFAAGMDEALMQLRSEYPDANIQAFADDVGGDTGNERVKATDSLPKLPDAELDADGTMPVAAAIIVRWSELADELCGLEVRPDKCHVTSLNGASGLRKEEYGVIDVCEGTLHMGIPIGSKQWEIDKVAEIANRVPFVYKQAQRAATKQCTQLLSVYCGGTPCLTHILRYIKQLKVEPPKFSAASSGRRPTAPASPRTKQRPPP